MSMTTALAANASYSDAARVARAASIMEAITDLVARVEGLSVCPNQGVAS